MADEDGNTGSDVFDDKSENGLDNDHDQDNNSSAADPETFFDPDVKRVLFRNATIVSGSGGPYKADLLVEDGKIRSIGTSLDLVGGGAGDSRVVAAEGLLLTPGSISSLTGDRDENSTLSRGCTVALHRLSYVHGDIGDACEQKKSALIGRSRTHFGFILQLQNINELSRNDLSELVTGGGVGVISLPATRLSNTEIMEAFKRVKRLGCAVNIQLERSELTQHFSRLGVADSYYKEDIEETEVRRICTFAKQVGVKICIGGVCHLPALEVIKEFAAKGVEIFAVLAENIDSRVLKTIVSDKRLQELVVMTPPAHVTDLASHVKMSCLNPAKLLGIADTRGEVATGHQADLVLWRREEDTDNQQPGYSVQFVMVEGRMVLTPEVESPARHGDFVGFTARVHQDQEEEEVVKRVEREQR